VGKITAVKFAEVNVISQNKMKIGSQVKNCGMKESCKANEFPIHVYNGKDDKDEPKICVDGR
jgi:hypothetical protein